MINYTDMVWVWDSSCRWFVEKNPFAMDADETQPMEPMEVEDASSLFSLEMPVDDNGEDEIPPTQPEPDEPQPHKVRRWQKL